MLDDLALGAVVGAGASVVLCRAVMAAGLVDMPGPARKPHRKPTPTSGGLGAAGGFAIGLFAVVLMPDWREAIGPDIVRRVLAATAYACAFAALGVWDDARPLGPKGKFAVFALIALLASWQVGVAHLFPITDAVLIEAPFIVALLGSALWVFTLINSVNFMDGANGLAMGTTAVGLLFLALISLQAGAPGAAALGFCGAAALAGFLVWNFPNGRLFAGDSGALFAGALAAFASLLAIHEGGLSPFLPPLLFFPVLADVLLTLAWRVKQQRRVLAGHAEHLYQIAIRAGATHASAAVAYWAMATACGVLAFVAHWAGSFAPPLALGCAAVVSLVASAQMRRYAVTRNMGEV